jgi:RNA polymerase sigma-70 factor (sigma-E family)
VSAADDFDAFVAARAPGLLRLARLLRPHDAEDLLQAALLTTWQHWSRLHDPSPPSAEAYARTTLHRLAARWSRRWWHRETPTQALPDGSLAAASGPEHRVDLERALATLPTRWRLVLVLRFAEDLSEAEVAQLLRCSVGTVKSSTSRALERLRALPDLDAYAPEQRGTR